MASSLSELQVTLKPKQKEFFDILGNGRDIIVNLPVGYGKSLLYFYIPNFYSRDKENPVVVVITPLSIIQKDQVNKADTYGIRAARMSQDGKVEDGNGNVSLAELKDGLVPILLCHPEGLLASEIGKQLLRDEQFQSRVVSVVVDECHIVEKWGASFRSIFSQVKTLPAILQCPMIAMSGTLTVKQMKTLPAALGLIGPVIIEETPDRPNIFLKKFKKESNSDVLNVYEGIYMRECDRLREEPSSYPVTLMFMPLKYISHAAAYLKHLFRPEFPTIPYSVIFSGQEKEIVDRTLESLQERNPKIRLILSTSVSGMGFDPPCIERVIHASPPRNISQYLQEIGRAGRRGQPSEAILYYSNSDISLSLPDMQQDIRDYCQTESCLRKELLSNFGFQKVSMTGCRCCCFCKSSCCCDVCSVLVPEVIFDLEEEMTEDGCIYEKIETSIVPMEQ